MVDAETTSAVAKRLRSTGRGGAGEGAEESGVVMADSEREPRRGPDEDTPPACEPVARRVHHNPVGGLLLQADRHGLRASEFWRDGSEAASEAGSDAGETWLDQACRQLDEYFAGSRTTFALPLFPEGTEFQRRVWECLRRIPFGHTWSYQQLAIAIDSPQACRAVGGANHRNPLAVIIPCHRVIGASGTLVGFGGGLDRKRWLLEHEQDKIAPSLFSSPAPGGP